MPDVIDVPSPPRRLRRIRGYARLAVQAVMLVVVALFGQLFLQIGTGTIRLLWFSHTAAAVVKEVVTTPGERGPIHEIVLTYRVDDAEYTRRLRVSAPEADAMHPGDARTVCFLPERPDAASLPADDNYPVVFVTICSALFALGPIGILAKLLWDLLVAPWKVRRLLRHGSVAVGVIVERNETTGKHARLVLTYEYEVPTRDMGQIPRGNVVVRSTMKVMGTDFVGTQVGDSVAVVYDAARPRRSVIYDYADYEFAPTAE